MSSLLSELQALEVELHHPAVRCSRERLEQLLHPDFYEVGRSGRTYDRATVIAHLVAQESQPVMESGAFALSELAPGIAMLTYRSAFADPEHGLSYHALRASVWVNTAGVWQMRYHQGTPAAEPW
jgi:hypothetical protein